MGQIGYIPVQAQRCYECGDPHNVTLHAIEKTKVEVILTIGAGDIDRLVQPIKKILTKNLRRIICSNYWKYVLI